MTGYKITPLQIAVAVWDFEGVKILLEAGANPNNIGDRFGLEWAGVALGNVTDLQGNSPLYILKNVYILKNADVRYKYDRKIDRQGVPGRIEEILLQYGARCFTTSEAPQESSAID